MFRRMFSPRNSKSKSDETSSATVSSSTPYAWPCKPIARDEVAVVIIDMQVDFCGKGGYVDAMGYDISQTRAPIEPLSAVLRAARKAGVRVIHTREGHRPSLSDLPENKRWRSAAINAEIGQPGLCGRILVRGEPGWEIIPELAPLPNEDIIDKPGKGSFCATDLDHLLRTCGVKALLLGGITTDVCVHTTMREANDRGYECLLITDGTGATDMGNHAAAHKMVTMQGGVFGALGSADHVCAYLDALGASAEGGLGSEATELEPSIDAVGTLCRVPSAAPSPFTFPSNKCALVMIDWQKDFLDVGGFGHALGNNVAPLQAALQPAAAVLQAARATKMTIVHTLEAHAPDLSDCPPCKKARCPAIGTTLDASRGRVLVAGEPGNAIVEPVAPIAGEIIVHKPGKGAFWSTNLQKELQARGITHLIVTGVTTEVCVQTTVREANDRGYDCLVVSDATESYFPHFKAATLEMIVAQGGIVGWTAESAAVVDAIKG